MAEFYRRHIGREILQTYVDGPAVAQPVQLGEITPAPRLALIDAVTTREDGTLYLHLINRSFDRPIGIDLVPPGPVSTEGVLHVLRIQGDLASNAQMVSEQKTVLLRDGFVLPKQSIATLILRTDPSADGSAGSP